MFVHLRVDASLVHVLPVGMVSAEVLAYRACVAFEQRGHLGPPLFKLLRKERPKRKKEIQMVEGIFPWADMGALFRSPIMKEDQALALQACAIKIEGLLEIIQDGDRTVEMWDEVQIQLEDLRKFLRPLPVEVSEPSAQQSGSLSYFDPMANGIPEVFGEPLPHEVFVGVLCASIYARVCAELVLRAP